MLAFPISSDHLTSISKIKPSLCLQRLHSKPNSSTHLTYHKPISTPNTLKWNHTTNTTYFLHPILCGNSSNTLSASDDDSGNNLRGLVETIGEGISTAFPIWVALGCFLGLVRPESYNWVQPKWTMMGITFTMLGMGMTLTFDDLKGALAMPKELFTGFCLQYSVSSVLPAYL